MILYVNACIRSESRTDRISRALLDMLGKYEEVRLSELDLKPLSEENLKKRTELIAKGSYSDSMFELAKQFSAADTIVIGAPFWDLSFPSLLKVYLENIYAIGIVTEYDETGRPNGLCKAKKLYYVTTAGGAYVSEYSFGYIKTLAEEYLGIPKTELIAAEMLDVVGYDAEKIVQQTINRLPEYK